MQPHESRGRSLESEAHWEWMRLFTRLKMTGATEDGKLLIEPRIYPVVAFEELFWSPKGQIFSRNLSGAGAIYHTVPTGKRWRVRHIWKQATTGAVSVDVYNTTGDKQVKIIETAAAEGLWSGLFYLDAAWSLRMDQGAGADSAISVGILYDEADSF